MSQSSAVNTKANNKWLIALLLLTVIATAWTALHEGDDKVDTEIVLQHISNNKQPPLKPSTPPSKMNQVLALEQTAPIDKLGNKDGLIPWQKLKREPSKTAAYDLFKVHSWLVIPPIKKVKPPPPPPVAPPIPFIYMGKLDNTPAGTQIFLMANNKLYTVVKGEKIDQQWRFDNEEGELLRLTYLPLSLQQTLSKFAKSAVIQPETTVENN